MDQFLINNRDCETLFNCNYIAPGTTGRQSPTTAHVYVLQSATQCSYRPEPKSKSQLIRTVYRYVIPQRGCDMIVCKCVCSKQEGSLLLQLGAIQQKNRTTIKRELAEMHSLLLWLLYRCSNCFRSLGPPKAMLWCVRDLAQQIVVCADFIFVPRSIGVVVAMLLYSHCRRHAEWVGSHSRKDRSPNNYIEENPLNSNSNPLSIIALLRSHR